MKTAKGQKQGVRPKHADKTREATTSARMRQAGGTPGQRGDNEGGGGKDAQVKHNKVQWEITEDAHQTATEQEVQTFTHWFGEFNPIYVTDAEYPNIFRSHIQVSGGSFSLFTPVHCVILNWSLNSFIIRVTYRTQHKADTRPSNSLVTKTCNCWMKRKKK